MVHVLFDPPYIHHFFLLYVYKKKNKLILFEFFRASFIWDEMKFTKSDIFFILKYFETDSEMKSEESRTNPNIAECLRSLKSFVNEIWNVTFTSHICIYWVYFQSYMEIYNYINYWIIVYLMWLKSKHQTMEMKEE